VRRTLVFLAAAGSLAGAAPGAQAAWAGPDPSTNFVAKPVCTGSAQCLIQGIRALDAARAALDQPRYDLPGNFAQLNPAEQAFVLTDLDRKLYGLPLIAGLTGELDQAAAAGVASGSDPHSSDPNIRSFTSNWARGYLNMPLAYEGWMYDDGLGSPNFDCTVLNRSGCWIHRHDILWEFGEGGPLAMGAAAGSGPGGPGYAMLLVQGASGYHPSYVYTWSEAAAAGAGAPSGAAPAPPSAPSSRRIRITRLRVRGHRVSFRVAAPRGVALGCALTRVSSRRVRLHRCRRSTTYTKVRRGRYRLLVRAGGRTARRYVVVR
jgi:hypothetical protein